MSVVVFPEDPKYWTETFDGGGRFRVVPVSEKGSYSIYSLSAGSYYVAAVREPASGDWLDPRFLEQLSATAEHLVVGNEPQIKLDLRVVQETR